MEFIYYYDFEDCFQLDLSGNPITYVVGSDDVLSIDAPYIINPIEEPNLRVCATYINSSVSTAATHYTYISLKYDSCQLCLESNNQVVTVSGITKPNLSSLNLIADSRFKKGDVMSVNIVYDDMGETKFINSPAIIVSTTPFAAGSSTIPVSIGYVPYDSFQQVIESKGMYYSVQDCNDGTVSTILSHQFFEKSGQIINLPLGDSGCKKILSAYTTGDYSDISGNIPVIYSTKVYDDCITCQRDSSTGGKDENFVENDLTSSSINVIKELKDGTILIGGTGLTHISGDSLYNTNGILKLGSDGSLILNFNSNDGGSLSLNNGNYIYTDYSNGFNFESDFTVEFWINYSSLDSQNPSIISFYDSSDSKGWELSFTGLNQLHFTYNNQEIYFNSQINILQWVHIAIVRNSDEIRLYVNGTQDSALTTGVTTPITATTGTSLYVGTNSDKTSSISTFLSNLRICQIAVYTGDFIPQTTPLTKTQNSFGNISSVSETDTTLLMNFESLSTLLIDNSIYNSSFKTFNPSVSYLAYTPVKTENLESIYDGQPSNSFVQLDLPDGFTLDAYGVKISTVYLGTNSYITFEQGSNDGGLVLPNDIPSINSSGLFISTFGDGQNNDNDTYIRRISTGYSVNDEVLVVRVEGGYKNSMNKSNQPGCCNCYTLTNISAYDYTVQYSRCDSDSLGTFTALKLNGYDFCSTGYINGVNPNEDIITPLYSFFAYRGNTTSQFLNSTGVHVVNFNLEDYDNNNNFNLSNDRYTAPADGGTYTFKCRLTFLLTANGFFSSTNTIDVILFKSDPSTYVEVVTYTIPSNTASTYTINHEFSPVQLDGGDFVQLIVQRRQYSINGGEFYPFQTGLEILSYNNPVGFGSNNYFQLSNVEGLPAVALPNSASFVSLNGKCGKLNDEPDSHWVCGDYDETNACNGVPVCTENIVSNSQFSVAGIPITNIPSWQQINNLGQQSALWSTTSVNSPFGTMAIFNGGTNEVYLQQDCLILGAAYEVSFDALVPRNYNEGCAPFFQTWVRAYLGSEFIYEQFTPDTNSTTGGLQRFTFTGISTGTLLKFRAFENCEGEHPISIGNICVTQIAPPADCQCYEIRHINAGLNPPEDTWFRFRWRDCSGQIRSFLVGENPLFPCVLSDNYSFANLNSSGLTNEQYAYVENSGQFCGFLNSEYCVEPEIILPCTCFEVKISFNATVEFLDCDGNYRFITNNIGPGVTISNDVCMTQIISGQNSVTNQGPCEITNLCNNFLPDPIRPIDGCTVMLNSSTDRFDVFLYDVSNNNLFPISLQGPYIFNNVNADTAYVDIAISQTAQRVYYKNNSNYEGTEGTYPASYIGFFNINFSAGTYVSGATINITPDLPFQNPYDFFTVNHGLEVDLDGEHVFLSSMNYSENNDVQSIILCNIVDSGSTDDITPVFCTCEKLFDLLPGRRVQGDMCRTLEKRLFITTTDGDRVYIEQWYTDGSESDSVFEFEINTHLSPGPNQIDIFIYEENLYCVDNNTTIPTVYRVNASYPYELEVENIIETIQSGDKFNGTASFPECNKFRFIYPDPRCRPLFLFREQNNSIQLSRYHFLPYRPLTQINVGTMGSDYPSLTSPGQIAHTFDYETNTGRMWVSSSQVSVFSTRFTEWILTGNILPNGEVDFIPTYNRIITLTNTVTNINALRFFRGFTAIDDNTLVIGARNGRDQNTTQYRSFVVQVNLTSPTGDLNLTYSGDTNVMFRLPIAGDPQYTFTQNFTPLDFQYTADNKLIVIGRPAISTTNLNRIILQYPYAIDADYEYINSIQPATGNGDISSQNAQIIGTINYNNVIFIHRNQDIGFNNVPWGGYIMDEEPNYELLEYLDYPLNLYPILPITNTSVVDVSSINPSPDSITKCPLTRFIPNVAPLIPTLSGCPVFLNSSTLEGIWSYNPVTNAHDYVLLPQYGDIGQTVFSFRDIAVCNVYNRIYALETISDYPNANPSSPWDNNLIYWEVDFETGTFIDGPFQTQLPIPVQAGALRLGEGLEVSPDGNLIYLSVVPIEGQPFSPTILTWDPFETEGYFYGEILQFTNGRRVKGDMIRTTNGKLFISTTDGENIYIEQYTTDDTLAGTILDGEIVFGPDVYDSFDIFLNLESGNSVFYAVASQNNISTIFRINTDITIVQTIADTDLQTINGAASYPSCHSFEFEFPDPRCRPLIVYSGQNQFFVQLWDVTSWLQFGNSTFNNNELVNIGTAGAPGNYPAPPNSAGNSISIGHIFDLETETGWMWIAHRPSTTPGQQAGVSEMKIYEWQITSWNQTITNFEVDFNRTITVNFSSATNNYSNYKHYRGIAGKDRNTLIIEAYRFGPMLNGLLATRNTIDYICELNINPSNGNNLSFNTHLTPMFRLPVSADTFYPAPPLGLNNNGVPVTVPKGNMSVVHGFYLGPNNKLVITTRGTCLGYDQLIKKYILQYDYQQSTAADLLLIPEVLFIPVTNTTLTDFQQGVTRFPITCFDRIRFVARTAQNAGAPFYSWIANPVTYQTSVGSVSTSGNIPIPNNTIFGPEGASPINSYSLSVDTCGLVVFEPNIITIPPIPDICPVFLVTGSNLWNPDFTNTIFYYDVNVNESTEVELPNLPTDTFFDVAYHSQTGRFYLLHGTNNTTDLHLSWWVVDFINGILLDDEPTTILLPNPEPVINGNAGGFTASLGVSEDGLSVFLITTPLPMNNTTICTIRVFNTTSLIYTTIGTLPAGSRPNEVLCTSNNRIFISYRTQNFDWRIRQIYVESPFVNSIVENDIIIFDTVLPEPVFSFGAMDLFIDNSNRMYVIMSTGQGGDNPSPNQSSVYEIDIYGVPTLLHEDTGIGRIGGAANSPSCATFSFQSQCSSLILWLGPTTPAWRFRVSRYSLGSGEPTFLDLGTSYNVNLLALTSLVETMDIAHSFDFTTNTGFLWIKKVRNTTTTYINEWLITDEFYTLVWNRLITLNTSNSNGVINRIDQGMVYVSPNVLAMGAIAGNNAWAGCSVATCRGVILQVNITNNSITFTNCTVMFNLPVVGSVNYTGTTNLLVWSGMYLAEGNLIITAKYGSTLASTSPMYILQYPYVIGATPALIQELGPNYTQPTVSHFPMTFEGGVYLVRNENTSWAVSEYVTTFPSGVLPVLAGLTFNGVTGPHGVSSINETPQSIELCEPVSLVANLCDECGLFFDEIQTGNIGIIVAGNLISTCQNNITDYVINWYGPNSTTQIAFTSGLGNQFVYDYAHPLTGEQSPIVTSGEYLPVIDRIILGGVVYSQDGSNGSTVSEISCFDPITVNCADCFNSNSTDPLYSYEFSFDGAILGAQTPPFQTCLDLPESIDYIAWSFTGFTAYDNIKVIYNGTNYSEPLILANYNVGTTAISSYLDPWNLFEQNVNQNNFKKVTCLTGLTRSPGFESISFQITSPTEASNWKLKYTCLETFDCDSCLLNEATGDLFKIDSNSLNVTFLNGSNQPTDFSTSCFTRITWNVKSCEDCSFPSGQGGLNSDINNYLNGSSSPYMINALGTYSCNVDYNSWGGSINQNLSFDGAGAISANFLQSQYFCLPTPPQPSNITYHKYTDGDSWVINVTSNSSTPITFMYQDYLNLVSEIGSWGLQLCGVEFSDGTTGPFTGGTINGAPSYLNPLDYRYYRNFKFIFPSVTGSTLCGTPPNDVSPIGANGNADGGESFEYVLHTSAIVTTGETGDGSFYLQIINQSNLETVIPDCVLYTGTMGIIINECNNGYLSPDVLITTQTQAMNNNPFQRFRVVQLNPCNPVTSYLAEGSVSFPTSVVNTLPFTESGVSVPESSATTCPQFYGYDNTFNNQVTQEGKNGKYLFQVVLTNPVPVEFNMYTYPVTNGVFDLNTQILVLTYVNGVVTFSDPNYVF